MIQRVSDVHLWSIKLIRSIKHLGQRITRGWDDSDLWNLDAAIVEFILPRLKAFRNYTQSYPSSMKTMEQWQLTIDKMIVAFELLDGDLNGGGKDSYQWSKDEVKAVDKGLKLFTKYLIHLWS